MSRNMKAGQRRGGRDVGAARSHKPKPRPHHRGVGDKNLGGKIAGGKGAGDRSAADRGAAGKSAAKAPRRESLRNWPTGSNVLVIGRNPVRELLRHCPERAKRAFTTHQASSERHLANHADLEIHRVLSDRGIEVREASFSELTAQCGTDAHQGWSLEAEPRPTSNLMEVLEAHAEVEDGVILLLDAIEDPQNLGSIIRAAECFGVEAVIWSKNRGAPLTASAVKASAGASELVTLIEVSNLHDAIKKCRDAGWWVLGAMVADDAVPSHEYDGPLKIALIVGSEGNGLGELTQKRLDQKIMIPLQGRLDSLNVGQASAVLLSGLSAKIRSVRAARES